MWKELQILENSLDQQQQHSRRNFIHICGISKQKAEDTDEQALNITRELWTLRDSWKSNLDQPHRNGAFKEDQNKCSPQE